MFVVVLRPGSGTDVYLRPDQSNSIDVYLRAGSGNDVYLRREGRPADIPRNAFVEYCVNVLGTPLHWYRMDASDPATIPDVGDGTTWNIGSKVGTMTAQSSGWLQNVTPSYSVAFNNGYVNRTVAMGSGDFNSTTSGTVSFAFKGTTSGVAQVICGAHPAGGAFHWLLQSTGAIQLQIIDGVDSAVFTTTATTFGDGQWHVCDTVCDGINPNKMYIDGHEVPLSISTAGIGTSHDWLNVPLRTNPTTTFFRIGDDARAPGTSLPFIGSADEVQFWEGALTATSILDKYYAAIYGGLNPSGTVAWTADHEVWSLAGDVTTSPPPIDAAIAWTEDAETWSLSGTVANSATIAWTEDAEAWSVSGTVTNTATIAWTEANDTWAVTGTVTNSATIAWTEANDTWALTGTVSNVATIAWTEQNDVWALTGNVANVATIAWIEENDIWSITADSGTVSTFPTQYAGFRVRHSGVTYDLCLVAVADAPAGMGGQLRLRKAGTTYAVYLVDTTDPDASPVRIKTSVGVKAIRLKT